MTENFSSTAAFIWSVADLLRGDFKQSQYGRIILPFTLLRRLECVLADKKDAIIAKYDEVKAMPADAQEQILKHVADLSFYNTSRMDLNQLGETGVADNIEAYVQTFSSNVSEIFELFDFNSTIEKLDNSELLHKVAKYFANLDLHLDKVDNIKMGRVYEELIERLVSSSEADGEYFTPRDVVKLITSLTLGNNNEPPLTTRRELNIYDPAVGCGGFLSAAMEHIHKHNDTLTCQVFGQELNAETYAICKALMLLKGQNVENIKLGNTLSDDQLKFDKFDYMLCNPPFGLHWAKVKRNVTDEHNLKGYDGRFGPGLPRINDGSLLFLLHLISKMRSPEEGGARIGIIFNSSPLTSGIAGTGESEIRRYILENDLLEAIVVLPADIFYTTSITTYIWILSNKKSLNRRGKLQVINAGFNNKKEPEKNFFSSMRKPQASKRKYLPEEKIDEIVRLFDDFCTSSTEDDRDNKIFDIQDFGYRRITVERPLQLSFTITKEKIEEYQKHLLELIQKKQPETLEIPDSAGCRALLKLKSGTVFNCRETFKNTISSDSLTKDEEKSLVKFFGEHNDEAEICYFQSGPNRGRMEPNPDLRDFENVPLKEDIYDYFDREVKPHAPFAWIDEKKCDAKDGKVGVVGYKLNLFKTEAKNGLRLKRLAKFFSSGTDNPWDIALNLVTGRTQQYEHLSSQKRTETKISGSHFIYIKFNNRADINLDYMCLALTRKFNDEVNNSVSNHFTKFYREDIENWQIDLPHYLEQMNRVEDIKFLTRASSDFKNKFDKFVENPSENQSLVIIERYKEAIDESYLLTQIAPYFLADLAHRINNSTEKDRFELILKFFECASSFLCSLIDRDKGDLHKDVRKALENMDKKYSTFGSWVYVLKIYNKVHEDPFQILDLVLPTLDAAVKLRNDTVGHGAIPTHNNISKWLEKAENYYSSVTDSFVEFLNQYRLVQPCFAKYDGAYHAHDAIDFSGLSGFPFAKVALKTEHAVMHDRLYLRHNKSDKLFPINNYCILSDILDDSGIKGFYFFAKSTDRDSKKEYICHQQVPTQTILV